MPLFLLSFSYSVPDLTTICPLILPPLLLLILGFISMPGFCLTCGEGQVAPVPVQEVETGAND